MGLRWYLVALVGIPAVMALGTLIVPGGLASRGPAYVMFNNLARAEDARRFRRRLSVGDG